jgi:hypothetical protein
MSFDLNNDEFDQKGSNVKIFNSGTPGIVNNTTMTVVRKKAEDNVNAPAYKLRFTDEEGAACDMAFWYVENATAYKTVEQLSKAQASLMKHVVHAIYGKDYKLPVFKTIKEVLDGCMKLIHEGSKSIKLRVYTNYGTTSGPKSFIQPRSWVPCIEAMSVSIEETRLEESNIENMERLVPSSGASLAGNASVESLVASDDGDWDEE